MNVFYTDMRDEHVHGNRDIDYVQKIDHFAVNIGTPRRSLVN